MLALDMDESKTETTALVYQVLDDHGVLGRVRAQLRAAVFTTVVEQERKRGIEGAAAPAVRELVETTTGALTVQLMTDFLLSLGLDATLSVFKAECSLVDLPEMPRSEMRRRCGLEHGGGEGRAVLLDLVDARRGGSRSGAAAAAAAGTTATAGGVAATGGAGAKWAVVVDEGVVSDNQSFDYVESHEGSLVVETGAASASATSADAAVDETAEEDDYSMSGFDPESPFASPANSRKGSRVFADSPRSQGSSVADDVVESGDFDHTDDLSQSSVEYDGS